MLTKSDVHSVLQCPRKLWLEKKKPDVASTADPGEQRRKQDGIEVGNLARKALGTNVIWAMPDADPVDAANNAKTLLLTMPVAPMVEVPLVYQDFYSRADAILPGVRGHILVETKASTFPLKDDKVTPAKPEAEYVADAAIQAWTMEQSGIAVEAIKLNLLNSQWTYPGNDDYRQMFREMDVTEEARALFAEVPVWIQTAKKVLKGRMPKVVTGTQCSKPQGCQFQEYCQSIDPPKPAHPIEMLPDVGGKNLAKKLKATKGYVSLLEPQPEELTGANSRLYVRMQTAHRTGSAILEKTSADKLASLPYPRFFLDFEGVDLAVPRWKGVRPYEQIPFQWACHIERTPGQFEFGEFLDLSGEDPSIACIHHLLKVIDLNNKGPILVYHATYEKSRLKELAKRHPQYAAEMENYISRLVDLLPIVKDNFYHPAMEGSFSIKKVLPVIAPDLNYENLSQVKNGTDAQLAYIRAALDSRTSPEEKAETDKNARIYCGQDTWAMVEVAYFLERKGRPVRPAGM